jgi:hypothetical protein
MTKISRDRRANHVFSSFHSVERSSRFQKRLLKIAFIHFQRRNADIDKHLSCALRETKETINQKKKKKKRRTANLYQSSLNDFSASFFPNFFEKRFAQVLSNTRATHDVLVKKQKPDIINRLAIALVRNVHAIHVHQNVANHQHGRLVRTPSLLQKKEK